MHYQHLRFLAYSTPTPQVLGGDPLPAAIQYRCLYTTTATAKASANSTSFTDDICFNNSGNEALLDDACFNDSGNEASQDDTPFYDSGNGENTS